MTPARRRARSAIVAVLAAALACGAPETTPDAVRPPSSAGAVTGTPGGRLVATLRAEPGTFNPVMAADRPSQTLRYLTTADLVHIDRETQRTEPALAESWTVSDDGTVYTLRLRRDVRFSDGEPFDADDVVFSFGVYLDPAVAAPNRSLLIVHGEPLRVEKVDSHTVAVRLAGPYAAGERLFDSLAMLPEHLLGPAWADGTLPAAWGPSTPPASVVGLGPFRPAAYRPGESLILERNPHYWRHDEAGTRLPYLDEIVLRFVASEDAEAIRFQNGESDVISGVKAANFVALGASPAAERLVLRDLGPGLEYNFLFFNLNDLADRNLPAVEARQAWFRQLEFRRAVSEAADRGAIARLVYHGLATPVGGPESAGNRLWRNEEIAPPERSLESASRRLREAGFVRDGDGPLLDPAGDPVSFTIVTNSSNRQRLEIAAILQEDLRQLGIATQVVPLEFQSLVRRVLETRDYDACVLGLGGGDVDPNSGMSVWLSSGARHLWAPAQSQPATPWEAEIDELMVRQLTEMDPDARKRQYDRVQEILARQVPQIYLVSPNVLAAAHRDLGNFRPSILEPSALWNADRLFWIETGEKP